MAPLLAPYNDSMRLGMGFNSYTQTTCTDKAVEATNENTVMSWDRQAFYSCKFVERLSDVTDLLSISHAAAIKNGTIQACGHAGTIDENQIKDSDISLVALVQIVGKTTTLDDSACFKGLKGSEAKFNEVFGDCYISGFIYGGFFLTLVSFRCSDPSTRNKVIRCLKQIVKPRYDSSQPGDLGWLRDARVSSLKDVQITISATWMGCDDIQDYKGDQAKWDLESVYNAAIELRLCVGMSTERIWAILTKYKGKRSFNEWVMTNSFKTFQYEDLSSLTAELFDNFMEYKRLFRKVDDIISHRDRYRQVDKPRAIPTQLKTLLAVRTALRNEMNKIVAIVNLLEKQPSLLFEMDAFNSSSNDELVRSIVDEAISLKPQHNNILAPHLADITEEKLNFMNGNSPGDSSGGFQGMYTPRTYGFEPIRPATMSGAIMNKPEPLLDLKRRLSSLIAPEIWADLLPVRCEPTLVNSSSKSPLVPTGNVPNELKILAAVCGIHDVTSRLQRSVKNGTLTIHVNKIKMLEDRDSFGDFTPRNNPNLSFIYKFTKGPMRICSVNHDESSTDILKVTSRSQHTEVLFHIDFDHYWSIVSVVYNGNIYDKVGDLRAFRDSARYDNKGGWPYIRFTKELTGEENELTDRDIGVIFYTFPTSEIQAAVSVGRSGCLLTDQPQLVRFTQAIPKEVHLIKKASRKSIKKA